MTLRGIVRKGVVALPAEASLPEGTAVTITPVSSLAERLRSYREGDPNFDAAIAAVAAAETQAPDPLEGEACDLAKDSIVREEFRKILSGG